jgi:hypothetical protein
MAIITSIRENPRPSETKFIFIFIFIIDEAFTLSEWIVKGHRTR